MEITKEQYLEAKRIVDEYEREEYEIGMRLAEQQLDEMDGLNEPCPTCGEIDGFDNPCCPNYDPLSYKNCGYA